MRRIALGLVWVFLLPVSGTAGGFQLSLGGLRQMGMGYAGVGMAWDASTIYYNPGALSFVSNRSIQFGAGVVLPATTYLAETPSIYIAEMEQEALTPVYVFASWKLKREGSRLGKFHIGLGAYNPFGSNSKWDDDWKGRFITQESRISTYFIQPTVSYQLSPAIGIGGGFIYGFGNILSRKALPVSGANNTDGQAELTGTGAGIGFSLGLYLKASEELSLGLSYRSRVNLNIADGEARFEVPTSLDASFPDTRFSSSIKLPDVITIGLGYQPQDRFTLAVDLVFTGWSAYDTLAFDYVENTRELEDVITEPEYKNTVTFRMGGEYSTTERSRVRAGLFYDTSPALDGFVSPELPDANRIGLTVGAGANLNSQLSLDVGYSFEFTGERTTILNSAQFGGTYKSSATTFGLGIRYAF